MVPERRVVRYAPITYDALGAAVAPTGAETLRFYTANKAVYGPSETPRLSQLLLPDEAAPAGVPDRVPQGANLAQLAAATRYTPPHLALRDQPTHHQPSATH